MLGQIAPELRRALKWSGVFMIMAGAVGTGICICRDRCSRVLQLKALERAFFLVAGEISYSRISLPEIFVEVGEKMYKTEEGKLGDCIYRIGERMQENRGQDIGTVWQEEMSGYLAGTKLEEQEKKLVLSFPEAVWFLDGPRQETAVNEFARELQARLAGAQQKRSQEDRMTMAFCLAAGIMAAILLL